MPTRPKAHPIDPLVGSFLRRKSWTDAGIANAVSVLNRWARFLHSRGTTTVAAATGDDCADYLRQRSTEIASSTLHREWQLLGWLYEWLAKEGELPEVTRRGRLVEQTARGPMNGVDAPAVSEPHPDRIRYITAADYRRVMASFDRRRELDCRNAAICSLMYWSGPRMSEIANALRDNYDPAAGTLLILGKGSPPKWRELTVLEETRGLLDRYLRRRGDDDGAALFASSLGGRDTTNGHLRPDAIGSMLERRSAALGVDVTAHQFRRAFTVEAKRRGIPETEISRQAGWEPQTAKLMLPRYTRDAADELTRAAFRDNDPTAVRAQRRRGLRRVG